MNDINESAEWVGIEAIADCLSHSVLNLRHCWFVTEPEIRSIRFRGQDAVRKGYYVADVLGWIYKSVRNYPADIEARLRRYARPRTVKA